MKNIPPQTYMAVKKKIYRDVKKQTELAFRKSDVKQKASALNLALPQYARYIILANIFKINDPESLEFDQLKAAVRETILTGGFSASLTAAVALTIIDEVQYNLLRAVMSKTVAPMVSAQIVKLTLKFGKMVGMNDLTEDQVLRSFYLSNISNVNNLKVVKHEIFEFDKLSMQAKLKHVSEVVSHGAAMAYSYEASATVANNLGINKVASLIKTTVLLMKLSVYTARMQLAGEGDNLEQITSVIMSKVKDSFMFFLTKIKLDKLKYIFRFVLEVIIGPLALTYALFVSNLLTLDFDFNLDGLGRDIGRAAGRAAGREIGQSIADMF